MTFCVQTLFFIDIVLDIVYSPCQEKVRGQGNGNFMATALQTVVRLKKARLESEGDSSASTESSENTSACAGKMGNENTQDRESPVESTVTGYRFVYMELPSGVFQQMMRKDCGSSAGLVL